MGMLLINIFSEPSLTSDEVHSPVYQTLEQSSAKVTDTDKDEEPSSEEPKETSTIEVVESSDIETQSSQTVPTETTYEETTGDLPSAPALLTEESKEDSEESKPELASYAEEVEAAIVVNAEVDVEKPPEEITDSASKMDEVEEQVNEDIAQETTEVSQEVTEKVSEEVTESVTEETDDEPAVEQESSTSISHSESTEQQLIETQPPQTGKDEIYLLQK